MKVKEKCQCDLCDCGRHRCKVHVNKVHKKYVPIPSDPADFKTSYQEQYTEHKGSCNGPAKLCVPVMVQNPVKPPFCGSTESKAAFHKKNIPPRHLIEKERYEKPEGNMMMITTKSADYTAKVIEKQKSFKPARSLERPKELPQFEGETTTASFYKAYDGLTRQQMYSEHPTNLKCNSNKFEGTTTAKHSYPRYRCEDMERTLPIKPIETTHNTGQEFYGVTTNSDSYQGLSGELTQPILHSPSYKPPTGTMLTETTTQAHYNAKSGYRCRPIIPQTLRQPPAQFHGKTTNMETYLVHPPQQRPRPKEKEKYIPPTEKMDTTSMHREYYKPHSVQRRVRKLSPLQRKTSAPVNQRPVPKFQDKTTHRDEFKRWQVARQKAFCEPPRLLHLPVGRMLTKTMQQSDFVYDRTKVERAKPIIPQVRVVRSEQPVDTLTSYTAQYKGLQNTCRLAKILLTQAQLSA